MVSKKNKSTFWLFSPHIQGQGVPWDFKFPSSTPDHSIYFGEINPCHAMLTKTWTMYLAARQGRDHIASLN